MTTLAPARARAARITPVLVLVLVFLCGSVAGALVMSIADHRVHPGATIGIGMSVTEWKEQLNLTDGQTRELTSILDDFSTYYDNVIADGNTRIMRILNDDQKRKFKEMIHRHQQK